MNALQLSALNRTLLLMRDELSDSVTDTELMLALSQTTVALVADAKTLSSHAAQTAYVTAAMLMARSGHTVYLILPPGVRLLGDQAPLHAGELRNALKAIGPKIIPEYEFQTGAPSHRIDVACLFGDSDCVVLADQVLRLNATDWRAILNPTRKPWLEQTWPVGALGAAGLAATEVFKSAMIKLRRFARNPIFFDRLFAPSGYLSLAFAPAWTPRITQLGDIDFISGGAITNAALYALLRISGAHANARIIEPDIGDISNLNRYMLLTTSGIPFRKVSVLRGYETELFKISGVEKRYSTEENHTIGGLRHHVFVGVDHIPSRWEVQRTNPQWLGIGATTHWSAMSSFHTPELACARCSHPVDDPEIGPIPTVAFVSFMAGLLLSSQFLCGLGHKRSAGQSQQVFVTPLRPEVFWVTPVSRRPNCPHCSKSGTATVAA